MAEARVTDIKLLCAERGWSRSRLIGELGQHAALKGIQLPAAESMSRMIRQWSSGERGLSAPHAELLSAAFGVHFTAGSSPTRRAPQQRSPAASTLITASARQSAEIIERVATKVEPLSIEQYAEDVDRLAAEYMNSSPLLMAQEAKLLRDRLMVAQERTRRPSQLSELYNLTGRVGGILAYAALDLGNPRAAMTNARSALACADLTGHRDLTVWVRGTQSLIARFTGRHQEAERYITAGLDLNPTGAALARLASGQAQCRAQLGDIAGTKAALNLAADAHAASSPLAGTELGLFGFARSKVHYYAASSLVCLPGGAGALIGAKEAELAIKLFRASPPDERFITDEVLVHIHGANAYLQQGQIEAAAELLGPVFGTPDEQRVSWHRQRLTALAPLLAAPIARGSRTAADLRAKLGAF